MEICNRRFTLRDVLDKHLISSVSSQSLISAPRRCSVRSLEQGTAGSNLFSPLSLIEAAVAQGTLWELELAFRTAAIQRAGEVGLETLLFLMSIRTSSTTTRSGKG